MTCKEMIAATSENYMLRQLAEECCELSQAALKLVRANKGETPVSVPKARRKLVEEMADVKIMFNIVYTLLSKNELTDYDDTLKYKKDRFAKRIREMQNPAT